MQQTRHARRIYVGGIGDATEGELSSFFNETLQKALGPVAGEEVVSVYTNTERQFAFVELKSIELTTACMGLDGILFKGKPVKIRRPNDYNPALVPQTGKPVPVLNFTALGVVGTTVPDSQNKIFIGGLPYNLGEEQVKELLQAFGPLKAFHLVKESGMDTSKGYGFCEYMDPAVTQVACEGLNDLELGDKTLTVRRAAQQQDQGNPMPVGHDCACPPALTLALSCTHALLHSSLDDGRKSCYESRTDDGGHRRDGRRDGGRDGRRDGGRDGRSPNEDSDSE
jgi:splicing factor U2AF subunit